MKAKKAENYIFNYSTKIENSIPDWNLSKSKIKKIAHVTKKNKYGRLPIVFIEIFKESY